MLIYACTIFLSAFLLFLVQPIIAKQILPWFGGAASVWATCLVFFQTVLLFGYAYADWSTRKLQPRQQAWLHTGLLAFSLLLLPIIPGVQWKPGGEDGQDPALAIIGLLTATIGLQYFLISTTSPLMQAWYWRKFQTGVPYRLFALSNFASLLALLSYPVAIEPFLTLAAQSISWSVAYGAFAVLCAFTAFVSARAAGTAPVRTDIAETTAGAADLPPAMLDRIMWIALSAMGSCMLLAVTNHLTQNIPSIPFLWVVPLSLYLITFILCFDHPRWYQRPLFLAAVAIVVPAMAWNSASLDLWVAAPLFAVGLFICCMFCHGELYLLKPGPRHLTTFYLMISVGGAVGSLVVGILAPSLLPGYFEVGITLIACVVLLTIRAWKFRHWAGAIGGIIVIGTGLVVARNTRDYMADTRVMMRNFYGVVRTRDFKDPTPFRAMYHGAINHGGQLLEEHAKMEPTSYFGRTSGYGRVFASLPAEGQRRIGIIGLGAGAIAAYARKGDVFRFYEIDPQVAAVALREFTFLKDSGAVTDVILGDGRLSLEREKDQQYDLLAIDAFSGDSIPMHLVTREAMTTYVRHLKPDGVLVFQATNRFVDIAPVVERLAAEFGYTAVMVSDWPENDGSRDNHYWVSSTDQIIVTKNKKILEAEAVKSVSRPLEARPGFRVWTDDFYNLVQVLKK
jgi:hypothetical protein